MKKSVLKMCESAESIFDLGNHSLRVHRVPKQVAMLNDFTDKVEQFTCTREMRYFGSTICAVNDERKEFRLSHCGVHAANGGWPKTTTQTLLMYRDYFCTDGYTEVCPIEGRPARDWRAHQEEFLKQKAQKQAALAAWRAEHGDEPMPRKRRASSKRMSKKSLMKQALAERGVNYDDIMAEIEAALGRAMEAKQAEDAEQVENLPVPVEPSPDELYAEWEREHEEKYHPFDFNGDTNLNGVHATRGFWELLPYYPKEAEKEEKPAARKTVRKTTKKPAARKTVRKTTKKVVKTA